MMANYCTKWAELAEKVPEMRPDAWTLRDLAARTKLPSVIPLSAADGWAENAVSILAAATNCESSNEGDPCGVCPRCADAFSNGSLAIIWLQGSRTTARDLQRLRLHLLMQQSVRRQIVVIDQREPMRGKAAGAALKNMLGNVREDTTFVLITRGEEVSS